jgi:hypothetical protein
MSQLLKLVKEGFFDERKRGEIRFYPRYSNESFPKGLAASLPKDKLESLVHDEVSFTHKFGEIVYALHYDAENDWLDIVTIPY